MEGEDESIEENNDKQNQCTDDDKATTTRTATLACSSTYQYPLKVGLKSGYNELVMRSLGMDELSLLVDDLPAPFCRMDREADYNE